MKSIISPSVVIMFALALNVVSAYTGGLKRKILAFFPWIRNCCCTRDRNIESCLNGQVL